MRAVFWCRRAKQRTGKNCHCRSVTKSNPTLCDPMDCGVPGSSVLHHLLGFAKIMSMEPVMPCNHLTLYCPLLLFPSVFPSIRAFSSESALHITWPKYWSLLARIKNHTNTVEPGPVLWKANVKNSTKQKTIEQMGGKCCVNIRHYSLHEFSLLPRVMQIQGENLISG